MRSGELIALVGAGGKTTAAWLLLRLLVESGEQAVFTTTTRIFRPRGITAILLAVVGGTFAYRLFLSIALRYNWVAPSNLKLITALLVIVALAIPYVQKKIRHEWIPPAVRM